MINETPSLMLKALLVFWYIFGSRVKEALPYPEKGWSGLKPKNFKVQNGTLVVDIPLLKKRDKGPIMPRHILRVRTEGTPFIQILLEYVESKSEDQVLWPRSRVWAWQKIKRLNENFSPYLFRHNRLKRLANLGATGPELMEWAGWADLRPSGNYLTGTGEAVKKFADKIE